MVNILCSGFQVKGSNTTLQSEELGNLQKHVEAVEAELASTKEKLDALRAAQDSASASAATEAPVDQEALVKAKADFEAVQQEVERLKAEHTAALAELSQKLEAAEQQAAGTQQLEKEMTDLKAEREESANRVSELEVEILELREASETAEDEHAKSLARIKSLEEELTGANAATEKALQDAKTKEEANAQELEATKKQHADVLEALSQEKDTLATQLASLQTDLQTAGNALEASKAEAEAASAEHARKLEEIETAYRARQDELTEEIARINAELEGQEAKYNAKVDAVKVEHDELLRQAFEKAKHEAGDVHGQDLHSLRAESQSTIEQLRAAHQSTVDSLKAEHEEALQSQVQTLENRLNSQNTELKATGEDLAKAKAALTASLQEVEALKSQLEQARQAAASVAGASSAGQAFEVERLKKDLSNTQDDLHGLTDVFQATKESMTEMSRNHQKELEAAAVARAEEVTKLRAVHDNEIHGLAKDKAELFTKLSDMEGELATLRASVGADVPTSPRRNGTAQHSGPAVSKEELQRMYEAHNLKLRDLQADHEKATKNVQEQLEAAHSKLGELKQDIDRKNMEIKYLEQDQEESQDQITRYVKFYGFKSFLGSVFALAVVIGFV
ncbi:hypothetical protein EWM64_g4252 [Hericium alpestre]|uniref:Uncharacterized protein n=1 Tax=Hericium alpestre TaxID=135208 RepID=A0A4Y9ZZX1_9AGAM|nr:hypothetical protein EWM64_g4252 [Hericium alpestre]